MAVALMLLGCGGDELSEPYLLVHIDTDAPLPDGRSQEVGTPQLFDTLEIMVFDANDERVDGSWRTREIDASSFAEGMSFALVPRRHERVVLQAMLFRRAHRSSSVDPTLTDLAVRF